MRPLRFCIVTSAHICDNPRVVKEADALAASGHDVRVVAFDFDREAAARDSAMMASRPWSLEAVRVGPHTGAARHQWMSDRIASRVARHAVVRGFVTDRLCAHAAGSYGWRLARRAAARPADLVIGHNLQALPAAAWAANRLGAKLGFDFEDLHSEEYPATTEHQSARRLSSSIERRFIGRCRSITASSEGIADAVARIYGLVRPTVVLNAFPIESNPPTVPDERRGRAPSLYWYSQVIGPGRGLEDVIDAIGKLTRPVQLHLRGRLDPSYEQALRSRASAAGVGAALHLHPIVPPGELIPRASQHDIGLALEEPNSLNRSLCVTNKILTYLVSGLAVAATDTVGQRGVIEMAPGAGFLYPSGDPQALAAGIESLLGEPGALRRAKDLSAAAAAGQFSWARQEARLLSCLVAAAIPDAPMVVPDAAPSAGARMAGGRLA